MAGIQRELSTGEKKRMFLRLTQAGMTRQAAADEIGITMPAVTYWRRSDGDFCDSDDRIKAIRQASSIDDIPGPRDSMISFEQFSKKYLDTTLFAHHKQWIDLIEGREPLCIQCGDGKQTLPCPTHHAQTYVKGSPDFLMINTPPEHAKSTTITVNYVTYRICQDPNIRVILVSQTQEMAKRFLRGIKDRLAGTNPAYRKLQIDFAPDGGFDKNSAAWTSDSIYVSSSSRDSGEPSPTVIALGLNGQIYGARADLIIFDDTVTGKNAHEFLKQMDWMQREVYNRMAPVKSTMLLVGTRLSPNDLYGEILKNEYYNDEESPWTYLTQPAVLEYAPDPKDWVTLWPRTNRRPVSLAARDKVTADEDGLFPMWDGPALAKRRASMGPRNWALVYQQENVVEDAIFKQKAVMAAVDGMRQVGPLQRGAPGHREYGMEGCYVVGGFDPAITGHSAAVVMAVDRQNGVRWVMDVWTQSHLKPEDIFDKIKEWTVKYRMNEWRIEKNAMNMMVSQSRPLKEFLAARGCVLKEHFTGSNKWDEDFGVASMSVLFDNWESRRQLIRLPSRSSEGVKALVEQLTTWEPQAPGTRNKKKIDCVMALWFAEIRARELMMDVAENEFHIDSEWTSERDRTKQIVIDLDYYQNFQLESAW